MPYTVPQSHENFHQSNVSGHESCNVPSDVQKNNSNSVEDYIEKLCSSVSSNMSKKNKRAQLREFKRFIQHDSSQSFVEVQSIIVSRINNEVTKQQSNRYSSMLRSSTKKLDNKISLLQGMGDIVRNLNDSQIQCFESLNTLRSTPRRARRSSELHVKISKNLQRPTSTSPVEINPSPNNPDDKGDVSRSPSPDLIPEEEQSSENLQRTTSTSPVEINPSHNNPDDGYVSDDEGDVSRSPSPDLIPEEEQSGENLQRPTSTFPVESNLSPDNPDDKGDVSRSPSPVCMSNFTMEEGQSSENLQSFISTSPVLIPEEEQSGENLQGSTDMKRKAEENADFVGQPPENKRRNNDLKSKTPLIIAGSLAVMSVAISVYLEMVMIGAIAAVCIAVIGVAWYCCNGNKEQMDHEKVSELAVSSIDKGVTDQQANTQLNCCQ